MTADARGEMKSTWEERAYGKRLFRKKTVYQLTAEIKREEDEIVNENNDVI